jgi:hypothetical protein
MQHSTFEQPLPKALAPDMSQGYDTASGEPKQFEIIDMSPAGALSAAGDDLARFMIAHLNDGSYNGMQILKPETAKFMHSMALQVAPDVPGMAYGFYHEDRNGHDVIGHGGDTQFFHSDLHLIMDGNTGLYISMNSAGRPDSVPISSTRRELFDGFMDRYFPARPTATPPAIASAKADAALVAGRYRVSRRSEINFLSLSDLFGQVAIAANDDGTLSVPLFLDDTGKPKKYREIAPGHWREVDGPHNVDVIIKNGQVDTLLTDEFPQIMTVQRVSGWESAGWRFPLLIAAIAMLLLTVLFWPLKALLRWRYKRPFDLTGQAATLYRLTRVVALLDVVFVIGWAIFLTRAQTDLTVLTSANDWVIRAIQLIGLLGAIGTIAILLEFWTALFSPRPWWTKATDALLAVAALVFVWFAFAYHLISAGLNY